MTTVEYMKWRNEVLITQWFSIMAILREEGPVKGEVPLLADIPVTDEQVFAMPSTGTIESLVPGKVVETPAGSFWKVSRRAAEIWERGTATHEEYIEALAPSPSKLPAGFSSLAVEIDRSQSICR